jgi:hypothetical protein
MKKIFLTLAFICFGVTCATSQTVDADDNQSWNDVQFTVPVNAQFDFTLAGTLRFGRNITRLSEWRIAAGFAYKPHKSWLLHPFYQYIKAQNARGVFLTEHRLNLRAIYRFPIKTFGLSHRSWVEQRIRQPRSSWRYRPSLTVEKDIGKIIHGTGVFLTEEVFYDSILKRFSRNRFTVGVTKKLTRKLSFDVYYMRQKDESSIPGDLNVIGTNWKVKF